MSSAAEDRGDDLAPDATLAVDIPNEDERTAEQLEYFGGDPEDLDKEDFSAVDRGDDIDPPELMEDAEEEQATEDEKGPTEDESLDDGEVDSDPDSEEVVEDDEGDDGEDDDSDVAESDDGDTRQQKDPDARDQRIPLSRFNEVNERMKQAEQRLAELERNEVAVEEVVKGTYDFDQAEEEYTELLLNGDTKGAATKRSEIRSAERESFLVEAQQSTQQTITQDAVASELNSLADQAAELYPIFKDTHPDFDADATQKVLTFMRGYMSDTANPMQASDAFVAALADGISLYDLDSTYGHNQQESDSAPKDPKKSAPKRKTKEKIDVAAKQARSPAGAGRASMDAGANVPDVDKMSDAEIEALPAETLARLRGDFMD
jgi:hypothetical protein